MAGVSIEELGIDEKMKDHVHLVMIIPPKYGRSDVVAQIKARSISQSTEEEIPVVGVYITDLHSPERRRRKHKA